MELSPSEILTNIIRDEERRLLGSMPGERRWELLELVRAIDYYFVYVLGLDEKKREEEVDSERWDLYRHGQSKAVSLFVDPSSILPGASLTRSTPVHQQWADAMIQSCGRLAICEAVLGLHRYDLVELSMPSPRTIQVKVGQRELGVEPLEADESRIFGDLAEEIDQHIRERLLAIRPGILALMAPLVSPWEGHFIQYDTIPEVDNYFHDQGHLWARSHYQPGQDAFPLHATFGDLPFEMYREGVVHVISWTLKHIAFCGVLRSREAHLDWRNVLTITKSESQLQSDLSIALGITEAEARQVLDTLRLMPENVAAHTSEPVANIAPFLSINAGGVVHSIAGVLESPFDFMLSELRRRYPADWDRAVDQREKVFRNELNSLFPVERFVRAERPLRLKNEGATVTDIDAALFDSYTGTLGLFQLKWQDPFGTSMKKRNSKMKNFLTETNRWVSTVSSTLEHSPTALANLISERAAREFDKGGIRLFVIGRHFSHFSGGVHRDSRAAWGTWPQMLRLLKQSHVGSDPVAWLHETLQEQSPSLRTPIAVREYQTEIGGYRIKYGPALP